MELKKHWNESEKVNFVEKYKASGLSIAEYCRRESLAESTFHGWLNPVKRKSLVEERKSPEPSKFFKLGGESPFRVKSNYQVELEFPNGLVLRVG